MECIQILREVYRTSILRSAQSSRNRASTSLSKSFAIPVATLRSRNISSGGVGTPPALCKTHISRCALSATLIVPALSLCSSNDGSTTGRVVGSGKNANVTQNGVWWIASGTGARSSGACYDNRGDTRSEERRHQTKCDSRTTMTSSPITSTSGRRKCLKATMLVRQAQSSMFPASARQWTVRRRCHT